MSQGGGVRKEPKKCHVLFEWPLSEMCLLIKGLLLEFSRISDKFLWIHLNFDFSNFTYQIRLSNFIEFDFADHIS